MNIFDYADVLNLDMTITYFHNQNKRFCARFSGVEVKTGEAGLLGAHGNGTTPEAAIKSYAEQLSGETMVHDAMGDGRYEKKVPALEYP